MALKIRILGLALTAILAISALIASAAQATEAEFMAAEAGEATLENESTLVLTTEVGTLECSSLSAHGEVSEGNQSTFETEGAVELNGCDAFGLEAEVNFNGCELKFHAGESTGFGLLDGHG